MNDPIEGELYRRPTAAEPEQFLIKSEPAESGSEQGCVPCPVDWCDDRETGHPYDSDGGRVVRCHNAEVGYLTTSHGPHGETWVDLMALQTVDDGELGTPEIRLYASYSSLTPAQARQVAGWLTVAAERLEALQ